MIVVLAGVALAGAPVVGGHPAEPGRWPDVAAVMSDGVAFCTGTLVAPDVVLTAGHCVDGQRVTGVKLDAPNWVTLGEYHAVTRAVAYPDWETTYDVGVLELAEPTDIVPRTIAQGCIVDDDLVDDASIAVVGYGTTHADGSGFTFQLNEGFTSIVYADCDRTQLGCNASVMPGGELVAGGDGVDTCFGDSGGPLVLLTARGEYLAGVTSRTFTQYGENPCELGGIYTRADAVVDWIEQETGRTLSPAVCGYPPAPDPLELTVDGHRRVTAVVDPADPDRGDGHTFELVTGPSLGRASVNGKGKVVYKADRDYVGDDAFTIRVTDDSEWELSADVAVSVDVIDASGCSTGGGRGSWVLVALSTMMVRRRARRTG